MRPWLRSLQTKRLFNAAKYGGAEYVGDSIRMGADATRISTVRNRTALIMNCGGNMPSLAIVQQLLAAGVDVHVRDVTGRTALDWARFRLAEMGPWTPDELPTRSPSLDEFGNIILHDFEKQHLDELRIEHPEMADEFIQGYMESRREAALTHFNPRAEYEAIIPVLERAMQAQPAAG
ncbi:MAG: hypothetical protein KF699_02670 [Phycisphaeraceae bacterium]|nr:hypothetical protein [Phycisphaeraceae bacterium]MBX3406699.1 hypothetical protein [Phycisphaeraceae bacterium]